MAKLETGSTAAVRGAQSLLRVLGILKYVGAAPARGAALTDVVRDLGLTPPTAYRMLSVLLQEGFLSLHPTRKTYSLGREAYLLGVAAEHQYGGIKTLADPVLRQLAHTTQDTCFLSVRSHDEAICIDRQTGSFPIKILTLDISHRRPLGLGAGSLALLAFLPRDEIEQILTHHATARTAHLPAMETLRADIAMTREKGYAINPGRIIADMIGVGVPVLGRDARVLAALSVAAIRSRLSGPRLHEVVSALQQAAKALGAALTSR